MDDTQMDKNHPWILVFRMAPSLSVHLHGECHGPAAEVALCPCCEGSLKSRVSSGAEKLPQLCTPFLEH